MAEEPIESEKLEMLDGPGSCFKLSEGVPDASAPPVAERLANKDGDADASPNAEGQAEPDKGKGRKKKVPEERDENGRKIFTENSGLGFMRVIQIYNFLQMSAYLFTLIFVTHSMLHELGSAIVTMIVFELFMLTLVIWALAKRKRNARFVVPVLYFICSFIDIISMFVTDQFQLANFVWCLILPVLMTIYFATSRRAKAVLVNPLDAKLLSRDAAVERKMWNPRSSAFWMRILIYFFAFSVIGHWMEMGVQILVVNGLFPGTVAGADSLTWRDHWNPFFIYGIAVAFCGLVLFPLYVKLKQVMPKIWMGFVLSFLLNLVFVVVAEVVLGTLFNADYQAWDYRNQFLNWNGQVCLLYSLAFAVMASIITWVIYPFLEFLFSFVGRDPMRVIFVISLVFFIFLFCTYNVDLTPLYQQAGIDPTLMTKD